MKRTDWRKLQEDLNVEFEQDWSVGLRATFGDGESDRQTHTHTHTHTNTHTHIHFSKTHF